MVKPVGLHGGSPPPPDHLAVPTVVLYLQLVCGVGHYTNKDQEWCIDKIDAVQYQQAWHGKCCANGPFADKGGTLISLEIP